MTFTEKLLKKIMMIKNTMEYKMSKNLISISARLLASTVNKINKLSKLMRAQNRADVIGRSVDIADLVIDAIINGNDVVIENSSGDRKRIVVHLK